jgi:site-specific DNA recombinase
MEQTHITKAVAYCRVSSQKQVSEGNGLESQRARIEEYAKFRGYQIIEVFKDDMTGSVAGRPGMKAMLAYLASKREPYIVIVDDVTRLARSMATHLTLREKIKKAGGILKSPSLEFGDDSDSQLVEHLLASVSQHQRQKISETTKNRMRGRMLNGYYTYRAPIGYCYHSVSGQGKVLKRDEPYASIIAEIYEGYASGRFQSPSEIMRYLEVHPNWPETRRNHITFERVSELLNRPLYAGMIDAPEHGIHMRPGIHEPLISFATYQAVQEKLHGKPKLIARIDTREDFPLRGFVECADCGKSITSCWSKGRNEKFPYYICQTRGCPSKGKSIRRDTMEGEFAALLKRLRPTPELYQLASELFRDLWNAKMKSSDSSRAHLIAEAARVDRQVTTLVDRIVNADSPTLISAYEERLRALEIQKAEMRERVAECGRPERDFDDMYRTAMEFLENPAELWFSERLEDKRAVLKLAFDTRITYHRDTGYRTPKIAIPFSIFNDLGDDDSHESVMVPRRGLEPPRPCERQHLKLVRLPIPPSGHGVRGESAAHLG